MTSCDVKSIKIHDAMQIDFDVMSIEDTTAMTQKLVFLRYCACERGVHLPKLFGVLLDCLDLLDRQFNAVFAQRFSQVCGRRGRDGRRCHVWARINVVGRISCEHAYAVMQAGGGTNTKQYRPRLFPSTRSASTRRENLRIREILSTLPKKRTITISKPS